MEFAGVYVCVCVCAYDGNLICVFGQFKDKLAFKLFTCLARLGMQRVPFIELDVEVNMLGSKDQPIMQCNYIQINIIMYAVL